jgi:rhamnosyltransferase
MKFADRAGSNVLAVVVSFNGGREILECIGAISPQVGRVLVVDNGSLPNSLDLLEDLQREGKIQLIPCGSNLGLAAALNLGVKEGLTSGFEWILTLDQDSSPSSDMLEVMLNYSRANDNTLVLSPNFVSRSGEKKTYKNGEVKYVITSGNLIHKSVLESVGFFNAGYFIDCLLEVCIPNMSHPEDIICSEILSY